MNVAGPSSLIADEKSLAGYSRAVLNILEDFTDEKARLESTQKAMLNILEDASGEKQRLEEVQRAVLNILEDLEVEKRSAEAANRMKSEFLANMSHELRTPLNGIIGFAQLMHSGKVGSLAGVHQEFVGDILTSSRHLLQLINDILDLAKVEAGRMEFQPEAADLQRLVIEVQTVLKMMALQKRLQVDSVIDPAVTAVVIDVAKFKQILYNYLSNAIKFTPDGGQIVVRVTPEAADTFRLEVEDTGIGIRAQDLGRLFVEFQQLDASTTKRHQGTGLGLALTKRIVEAQGGTVGVRSVPGRGSTFWAVLPRMPRMPAAGEGDSHVR